VAGAGAGADDDPTLTDALVETGEPIIERVGPEELAELDRAFELFEACLDEALGEVGFEGDEAGLDEAFEAAEVACEELLPDEVRAEIAAFEPFEACLDEAESGVDAIDSGIVWLDTIDGSQAIQFGDAPGTVTLTGNAMGIEIASSSGVSLLDEAALDELFGAHDAAFEACEQLLPDDGLVDELEFLPGDGFVDELDFGERSDEDDDG
ncbi:MAG: hypothetical protein ACR2N9_00070, partial [Acidimicrobiia bacterium]